MAGGLKARDWAGRCVEQYENDGENEGAPPNENAKRFGQKAGEGGGNPIALYI